MTPFLLVALLSLSSPKCVEENLAHFYSHGVEVAPDLIGRSDPCDDFGGAGLHTPKYEIWVYVNFNVPALVDLDAIDRALDALPPDAREFFLRVQSIAVVGPQKLKRLCGREMDACVNWFGTTLFVSYAVAARPDGLDRFWREFYSLKSIGQE